MAADNFNPLVTMPAAARPGDVILRAPVVLQGQGEPAGATARQDATKAPSVVELYGEPATWKWNIYRRVVVAGDRAKFVFFFDQPVKWMRVRIGSFEKQFPVRWCRLTSA